MFYWEGGDKERAEISRSALGYVKPSVSLNTLAQSSGKKSSDPEEKSPKVTVSF